MSAADIRQHLAAALAKPTRCQGVCGRWLPAADLHSADSTDGFEVCSACLASPIWADERARRARVVKAAQPATNVVGRRTVQG